MASKDRADPKAPDTFTLAPSPVSTLNSIPLATWAAVRVNTATPAETVGTSVVEDPTTDAVIETGTRSVFSVSRTSVPAGLS